MTGRCNSCIKLQVKRDLPAILKITDVSRDVTLAVICLSTGSSNLVPRASHLTVPWEERLSSLAPGGGKMRDTGNEVADPADNAVWFVNTYPLESDISGG